MRLSRSTENLLKGAGKDYRDDHLRHTSPALISHAKSAKAISINHLSDATGP
jgi:hypothetical protein